MYVRYNSRTCPIKKPGRMSECMLDRIPESDRMPEYMADTMSESMSDRMS